MEVSNSSGIDRSKIYDRDGTNTSSDDPEMMQSRLFIGNLKSNKITRKSIENRFAKYGKILGVSLHKSYGFVQFETQEIARKAATAENKEELHGVKMDICIATERRKPDDKGSSKKRGRSRSPRSRSRRERKSRDDDLMGRYNRFSPSSRMRGPLLDPYRDPYMDPYMDDPYDPYPPPRDMYDRYSLPLRRDYLSPPPHPFMPGDYPIPPRKRRERYLYDEQWDYPPPPFRERDLPPRERDLPPKRDLPPRERELLPPQLRERELPSFRERDLPHREGLPPRRGEDTKPSFPPPGPRDKSVPDAQIIIVNTHQKEYAQLVRERIESLGLSVEPLHLSPTVSLAEALENAARRGLMYTIIITSQHEAHRSVTLTILHGRNPQEHKNMPLDDAIGLIDRDYGRYRQNSGINSRGNSIGGGGASLMAKAAAGHNLSPAELNQLITSLQAKQQNSRVGGAGGVAQRREDILTASAGSNDTMQQQQADLQAKILSLLGSNAVVPSGGGGASKPPGGMGSLFDSSRFSQGSFGASSFH